MIHEFALCLDEIEGLVARVYLNDAEETHYLDELDYEKGALPHWVEVGVIDWLVEEYWEEVEEFVLARYDEDRVRKGCGINIDTLELIQRKRERKGSVA